MNELPWTGERLVTEVVDQHGSIEHLHRYALAIEICRNKIVLDIASGEGYGTALLAGVAERIYGVDIDEQSVQHAQKKYRQKNITFKVGGADKIPLENSSVNVVVSFETIEHLTAQENMMAEIKRVLKPGGTLLISSPEKSIYHRRDPHNPYHVKELLFDEFSDLLKKHFGQVHFFNQRFVFGSVISNGHSSAPFKMFHGSYQEINQGLSDDCFYNQPYFNIAVAGDQVDATLLSHSFFDGLNVLKREKAEEKQRFKNLQDSITFKTGRFLAQPLIIFRSWFSRR